VSAGACPPAAVQLRHAAAAAYPASANQAGSDLIVRIDVTVEGDGSVKSVRVVHSSGKADADASAMAAARASRYAPASAGCAPVEGHYAFTTTFAAPVTKSSEFPPGV
jgi:TonB family protein